MKRRRQGTLGKRCASWLDFSKSIDVRESIDLRVTTFETNMGSRSTRRKRELLAKAAMQAVTLEAAAIQPDQDDSESARTANPGAGGRMDRLDNGLTPIKDARLLAKSFSWKREQRYPTRVPTATIPNTALAEGRDLTALEVSIVSAAELAKSGKTERGREVGIRAILLAERWNQLDDHAKLKRPTSGGDSVPAGGAPIPPGGQTLNATFNFADSDDRRSRLIGLRDRLRTDRVLIVPSGSGQGSDPGRTDSAGESAGTNGHGNNGTADAS